MLLGQLTEPTGQHSATVPQGFVQYPTAGIPVLLELAVAPPPPVPAAVLVAVAVVVAEPPPLPPVLVVAAELLFSPPDPVVVDAVVSPPPLQATKPIASIDEPRNNPE
jgi:hypothetical protein